MRWLLLLLLVASCKKSDPTPAPSPSTVTSVASASSPVDAAPPDPGALARGMVDGWNDAHVKHDSKALERLYAPSVVFYGTRLSGLECAKRKAAAFKKSADFTQEIRDVSIEKADGGSGSGFTVRLWKKTIERGVARDFQAVLVLDAHLAIVGETDDLSEYNLARMRHENDWCLDGDVKKIIPPFKTTMPEALSAVWASKRLTEIRASHKGQDIGVDVPNDCPAPTCNSKTLECGWSFRVVNLSNLGITTSIMVDWIFVDAIQLVVEEGNNASGVPSWSEPIDLKKVRLQNGDGPQPK